VTGDAVTTVVLFGFAAGALFWLTGIAFHRAKQRSRERALLLVVAVALVAAVKWFWP